MHHSRKEKENIGMNRISNIDHRLSIIDHRHYYDQVPQFEAPTEKKKKKVLE